MNWKVVAAAVQGPSHRLSDQPCQDAYHWLSAGRNLCAIVSDGAGSALYGGLGAQFVSQDLCEQLIGLAQDPTLITKNIEQDWQLRILAAIEISRKKLLNHYAVNSLENYHATLVGVLCTDHIQLFFHIGDGAAAAVSHDSWKQAVLSLPENGEFADQTYFFTMDNWREHVRFTILNEADLILLMSDGAMPFTLAKYQQGVDERFAAPVTRYLEQNSVEQGQIALAQTLDNPKTYAITADDKTLLWAKWQP